MKGAEKGNANFQHLLIDNIFTRPNQIINQLVDGYCLNAQSPHKYEYKQWIMLV